MPRRQFLGCPVVALIHSGNAAAAAADMVQNRFGNFKSDTKPLQPSGDGSAQIVHVPSDKRRGIFAGFGACIHNRLIECAFGL